VRPSFLDDVSTAQTRRGPRGCDRPRHSGRAGTGRRAGDVSHQMSRGYVLEHPVDDPDDEDEDDVDEDDDGEDDVDEDDDEEEIETWQVTVLTPFR
jgi:hypothetical protein